MTAFKHNLSALANSRLAGEASPHLLKHADDPVDWHPWGEEAFELARRTNKLIYLSIGNYACRSCRLMAGECFQDSQAAFILNENMICVMVDSEERPDIDRIFQSALQAGGQPAGWPLSVFMTPEGKPFKVCRRIPRDSDKDREGMIDLIPRLARMWKERPDEIHVLTGKITHMIRQRHALKPGIPLDEDVFDRAYADFAYNFEPVSGGFGDPARYPTPHNLLFLLDYFDRTGRGAALIMTERALTRMRMAGIYDQLGFGFHRVNPENKDLSPDFEKLLVDQAMFAAAYTTAYEITERDFYKQVALEILDYALRELLSPDNAFYSAQSGESENEYGRYYLWTERDLKGLLTADEFELARRMFRIRAEGNSLSADAPGTGANILHLRQTYEDAAREMDIKADELKKAMEKIREKMFKARNQRSKPVMNEKILCDQNALMIMALSRAHKVFGSPVHLEQAKKTAACILDNLQARKGELLHCLRGAGEPIPGFLDDYSFMVRALIELYEASGEREYLKKALKLNRTMLDIFKVKRDMGLYFCGDGYGAAGIRPVLVRDGYLPSGISMALHNLVYLGSIPRNKHLLKMAEDMCRTFSRDVSTQPVEHTWFLTGMQKVLDHQLLTGRRSPLLSMF